jgi:phage-related protein
MAVGVAFVDILGDTSRAPAQIERDMNRALAVVSDEIDPVTIQSAVENGTEADLRREFNADIRAINAAIDRVRVRADLDPDTRQTLTRQLRETAAQLRASRSELEVRVAERPVVESTVEAVTTAVRVAEAVAPPIEIETRVDNDTLVSAARHLTGIGAAATGALKGVGLLGAGVLGLGAGVQTVAGLVAVLEAVAPAAAVGATAAVGLGLAIGTVKLATAGVSDAITAAFDPKKAKNLTESLKGLAPSAREFVLALQGLKPELKDIQQGVQGRFFEGFGTELQDLAKSTLPAVRAALFDTASTFNLMGKSAAQTAASLGESGVLGSALRSASNSLRDLVNLPGVGVNVFGKLAAAAGPSLEKIAQAASAAGDKLNAKVNGAFESGGLQKAIAQAITLLGQLGTVASNVFYIVGSVFSAADAGGGGLINTLVKVTDALAGAFEDPSFTGGLNQLFSVVGQLSSAAVSLLIPALKIVAQVFSALAPGVSVLIDALKAGLQPVIAALGPVLVSAGQAVTQLLMALSPLLPVIGLLISKIGPVLVPILNTLSLEFQKAAPLIAQFATMLGSFLGPILDQIPTLIQPFLDAFTQMITLLFPVALQLLQELQPSLAQLTQSFVDIATALAPVLTQLADLAVKALQPLLPLIPPIIGLVGQLAGILAGELARQIETIVVPALRGLSQLLNGDVDGAIHSFRDVAVGVAEEVVRQFITLPYKITVAFAGLGAKLFDIGTDLIGSLVKGIISKIPGLQETLSTITKMIPEWKGPESVDKTLLTPAGRAIMQSLVAGLDDGTGTLQSRLSGITRMIGGLQPSMNGISFSNGTAPRSAASAFAGTGPTLTPQTTPMVTQVFIGDRELTDIVDTRIVASDQAQSRGIRIGTRR